MSRLYDPLIPAGDELLPVPSSQVETHRDRCACEYSAGRLETLIELSGALRSVVIA